jgi:hypothetical protein
MYGEPPRPEDDKIELTDDARAWLAANDKPAHERNKPAALAREAQTPLASLRARAHNGRS